MSNCKVLFVSPSSYIGACERVLIEATRSMLGSAFEPFAIVPCDGELKNELETMGVRVLVQPIETWIYYREMHRRWRLLKYLVELPKRVRGIARIIDEENVGIVHSNLGATIEGALAAKLTSRPHIWHQHGLIREEPTVLGLLVPYSLAPYVFHGLSDIILCCSRFARNELLPNHLRRKARVFYNGIDIEKFVPGPPSRDLRTELGLAPGTALVGSLGMLRPIKGQMEFVEAAARVHQCLPATHFILAGNDYSRGTYLKRVQRRIEQLGAAGYIHYLGYRRDSVDIMRSLDVYVLASSLETMSLVVLEAMACGKPVIATKCGGPMESVVDGGTGMLVDVGDVDQIARAVIDLLSRPDRAASLGAKGRERVVEIFDQRKCLNKLPEIYQAVLSRDGNSPTRFLNAGRSVVSAFLELCDILRRMVGMLRKLSETRAS